MNRARGRHGHRLPFVLRSTVSLRGRFAPQAWQTMLNVSLSLFQTPHAGLLRHLQPHSRASLRYSSRYVPPGSTHASLLHAPFVTREDGRQ